MTTNRFWQIGSASFTTIIVALFVFASAVQAQSWTASISVENFDPRRPETKDVIFGVAPNSTNGIDVNDVQTVFPPAPSPQEPYLNVGFAGPGLSYLSTDIRPTLLWKLIVSSGYQFTLTWDISSVPSDLNLVIYSSDGRTIDMRTETSAAFPQMGRYRLIITIPAKITTVEPSTGVSGTEVTVAGVDFVANEQVTIDFGTATAIATATADENGAFSVTFPITVAQPSGNVTITATDESGKQAVDSTFVYEGLPTIPVNLSVLGSPAKPGETITVILEGEPEADATFSIEGVIADSAMVEDPPGIYTGTYVAEDITVIGATVTVTLTDAAGNSVTYTADQSVTIRVSVDFSLFLSKGINMISVPLDTTAVLIGDETIERPIKKVSDLAAVLGENFSLIISYNAEESKFQSFTPGTPETAKSNVDIGRSTGLIAVMTNPMEITFRGNGWQAGAVELNKGINIVSIPLKDPNLTRVSDLATALGNNMSLIISYDGEKFGSFTATTPVGSPLDVPIEGGKSLIVSVKDADSFDVAGEPWETPSPPLPPGAPMMFGLTGSPVLELDGIVIKEDTTEAINNLAVTVRHLSTGASMTDTTSNGRFSVTFVYLNNNLAHVGDILEIAAHDSQGNFRIDPIRYVLTESDIEYGRISYGNLVASVIPSRSELLANFPNPFNPETWIPFKLKEASDTSITIYDVHGVLVNKLELGYIPAGIYQTTAKAAYWDGTNAIGERVASGVYFYHLKAGKFSALRKMVILK